MTSPLPLLEENQDSKFFDDVDDSTMGPVASDIEKSHVLSEDSEDTIS